MKISKYKYNKKLQDEEFVNIELEKYSNLVKNECKNFKKNHRNYLYLEDIHKMYNNPNNYCDDCSDKRVVIAFKYVKKQLDHIVHLCERHLFHSLNIANIITKIDLGLQETAICKNCSQSKGYSNYQTYVYKEFQYCKHCLYGKLKRDNFQYTKKLFHVSDYAIVFKYVK